MVVKCQKEMCWIVEETMMSFSTTVLNLSTNYAEFLIKFCSFTVKQDVLKFSFEIFNPQAFKIHQKTKNMFMKSNLQVGKQNFHICQHVCCNKSDDPQNNEMQNCYEVCRLQIFEEFKRVFMEISFTSWIRHFSSHPTKCFYRNSYAWVGRKQQKKNLRQLLNHVICLLKAHFASLCVTCMNFGVYEDGKADAESAEKTSNVICERRKT